MPSRGGKREGAGRKPIGPVPPVPVTVTLLPDQIAELKRQGDGNLSEGIRRLLAEKGETK